MTVAIVLSRVETVYLALDSFVGLKCSVMEREGENCFLCQAPAGKTCEHCKLVSFCKESHRQVRMVMG